jgi:hypothetical protein
VPTAQQSAASDWVTIFNGKFIGEVEGCVTFDLAIGGERCALLHISHYPSARSNHLVLVMPRGDAPTILISPQILSDRNAQLYEFILVFYGLDQLVGLASTRLTLGDNSTLGRCGRQYDRIKNVIKGGPTGLIVSKKTQNH